MNVLPVPASLDYQTVDGFFDQVALAKEGRTLFDARHLRWVDPNGMVGLLVAGSVAGRRNGGRPRLEVPESTEVLGYLSRMAFFEAAADVFELDAPARRVAGKGASDVLLEITPVAKRATVPGSGTAEIEAGAASGGAEGL